MRARVILPDWYGDPVPDDAEMEARAAARDEALAAYQKASRDFDAAEPPLPYRWDNWREAEAREKRKKAAIKPAVDRLDAAREAFARGNCLRARRTDRDGKWA